MSWATKRSAIRLEDIAYSLFGIFDVRMPLLYGEGQYKAFQRLQEDGVRMDHHPITWACLLKAPLTFSNLAISCPSWMKTPRLLTAWRTLVLGSIFQWIAKVALNFLGLYPDQDHRKKFWVDWGAAKNMISLIEQLFTCNPFIAGYCLRSRRDRKCRRDVRSHLK
jgi:hypothetical protein